MQGLAPCLSQDWRPWPRTHMGHALALTTFSYSPQGVGWPGPNLCPPDSKDSGHRRVSQTQSWMSPFLFRTRFLRAGLVLSRQTRNCWGHSHAFLLWTGLPCVFSQPGHS